MNIAILGIGGVGKSSLIRNLKGENFEKKWIQGTEIEDHTISGVTFYDTPGTKFGFEFTENVDHVLILYDTTSKISKIRAREILNSHPGAILVANKCDISRKKTNNSGIFEISCKTGEGIFELIYALQ